MQDWLGFKGMMWRPLCAGGIFCVWFYDVKECDRIGRLFQR